MSNVAVPTAAEGMPSVQPFYREREHPAEAALVRSLGVVDLMVLYDAAQAIDEAILSIMNRPNCDGVVHDWLEVQSSRVSDMRTFIAEELVRRPMTGSRTEDERRMGVVISWDLHECGCSAMEAIVKLAQMQEAHEKAAIEKRHAVKTPVASPAQAPIVGEAA